MQRFSLTNALWLLCALVLFRPQTCHAELATAAQTPNILWITSEDNAAHWIGCYGNNEAKTPRLDALAAHSTLFEHAYSNAPVCAVARSTILHGVYAASTGTQHMRSRHRIPSSLRPYVSYLQDQGYYCTNKTKTDYNRAGSDRDIWDACGSNAHYNSRGQEQPFFAIFNLTVSHESSLFPDKIARNRERGLIPKVPRISPKTVAVPPHLPDLPAIRTDIAIYHDNITALDTQVGELLDELDKRGLADETIVFYYADHGGVTPRGKRYLTDTGVRVPMLVRVPEKWRHLTNFQPGQRSDELVAFVDLAPTLLSLAGIETPRHMQGRAFLGQHRQEPPEDPMVFLYADRFDAIYGMRRGLTNGRFKYIRRFTSHLPAAPCSNFSLGQRGWTAWMNAWQEGTLPEKHRALWQAPQPVEELYDLQTDPWEVNNLANTAEHSATLQKFRTRLQQQMQTAKDTGVIPEPMFRELVADATLYEYVRSESCDLDALIQFALQATSGDVSNMPQLFAMLKNSDPIVRYWGAIGCCVHGKNAVELSPHLVELANDESACVRMTAAQALWQIGKRKAAQAALISEFDKNQNPEDSILMTNLLAQFDCVDQVPQEWIDRILSDKQASEYFKRFVARLEQR